METALRLEKKGKIVALSSLIIGTIFLLIYFLTMSAEFAIFSYFMLMLIVLINLIVLAVLVIKLFKNKERKNGLLKTIGILLLNIPIAILYFYIVVLFTDTIRLTITNKTNSEINNLSIKGCDEKQIKSLNLNESTTVWIKIPNDCSIYAIYQINGVTKNEEIFDYVTTMMGQKVNYEIGINQRPIDFDL